MFSEGGGEGEGHAIRYRGIKENLFLERYSQDGAARVFKASFPSAPSSAAVLGNGRVISAPADRADINDVQFDLTGTPRSCVCVHAYRRKLLLAAGECLNVDNHLNDNSVNSAARYLPLRSSLRAL